MALVPVSAKPRREALCILAAAGQHLVTAEVGRPTLDVSCTAHQGGGQVAPGRQPHVDDLPILVDRTVHVRPPTVHLDVGLVDKSGGVF